MVKVNTKKFCLNWYLFLNNFDYNYYLNCWSLGPDKTMPLAKVFLCIAELIWLN